MCKMKMLFFAMFVLSPAFMSAQRAMLTFKFEMEQSGSQLSADSIYVENLSSNCDTMLYSPVSTLKVVALSGIEEETTIDNSLRAESWHFDTSDKSVTVNTFVPEKNVKVCVFDISGHLCCNGDFSVESGFNVFKIFGCPRSAVVKLSCGGNEASVSVVNPDEVSSHCSVQCVGSGENIYVKSLYSSGRFVFHTGDQLRFTMYSTACHEVISREVVDSPTASAEYIFDFTNVDNIRPDLIVAYDSVCNMDSIRWTWQAVEGAEGYKYNTIADYSTAVDLGTQRSVKYNQPLDSSSTYIMYVWAYNSCGVSDANLLFAHTPARPITDNEYDIVTSESSNFRILNIFEQSDSVVLRTPSINVDITDTIWNYLANRMYQAARTTGVGIAAPQVGINRKVVCLQRMDKTVGSGIFASHPWEFYFNPQIVEYSDSVVRRSDGCLSVPSGSAYPSIGSFSYRATWVKVAYFDVDGVFHVEKINQQYTAHIFQHEIDHLNAVMFFDRQVEENAYKFTIIEGDSYEGMPEIR
ncbi:MAG: peptide deformylase [Bacteroidales bacterium]|nr:peptide deformylase [Bacteroidales bacterium]